MNITNLSFDPYEASCTIINYTPPPKIWLFIPLIIACISTVWLWYDIEVFKRKYKDINFKLFSWLAFFSFLAIQALFLIIGLYI